MRCNGKKYAELGSPGSIDQGAPIIIDIADKWSLWKLALNPEFQVGELYMRGALQVEYGTLRDFLALCLRNQAAVEAQLKKSIVKRLFAGVIRNFQRNNNRIRSRQNVSHHYDLSADLYRLFLDADQQYSCAYFQHSGMSLEEAQRAKKHHIAAKLLLRPDDRVLDIGSGWGGLGITLAELGAGQVTGVTLSSEQLSIARQRAKQADINHRVEFLLQDYRDVQGQFDRIVSVGMFEHVGTSQYKTYFETIARLLPDDGVALVHSIGHKDPPGPTNSWIRKYIFPGGHIPALSEVIPHIEKAGLWITDIEILRLHYADTLHEWHERFLENIDIVKTIYDKKFCRMWEFYLLASEMGFRHGGLMVFQIQLAKKVETVPRTRDYMSTFETALHRREYKMSHRADSSQEIFRVGTSP